ncbi:MAG: LacI family DNA-binding transcriptional regulator [Lachnospiraceae bacterium]|nr:LacI family DNA-binding transcriptional regulator [Lachnospiraceae bacterium]
MARVTINMIAERAGVSRGTVDRVLHNRPEVAPEVREHVLEVAKLMGYITPNHGHKDSYVIGVVLPGNRWFDDNLKKEWMSGVQDAREIVEPLGYRVEVVECDTDIPGDIVEALENLRKQNPAGIAMTGMDTDNVRACIDRFEEDGVPVITYNSDLPGSKRTCFIGPDPYKSGRVAANMMFRRIGKSDRILAVAGNLDYSAHHARIRGFIDACKEAGISEKQIIVRESHNEYILTYDIVSKALSEIPELKAVYMANENIAACADALGDERNSREIMIVGNDLTLVTKKLLTEDKIDFIVEQNVYWQGYQPIIMLKKLIDMPNFPVSEMAFTNIGVVNAESIRQ